MTARTALSCCFPRPTPTCWPPGPAARTTAWATRPACRRRLPALLDGADVAVVRLLGGEQAWPEGLAALRPAARPVIVLGGEMIPDAALMALSSVPAGIAAQAHEYLAHGGPGNLRAARQLPGRHRAAGRARLRRARAHARPGDGGRGRPLPRTARSSPSSTTGRTNWAATPRLSTRCATAIGAGGGARRPGLVRQPESRRSRAAGRAAAGRRAGRDRARGGRDGPGPRAGRRRRRGVGRGRDRGPRHPGHPGPVPDLAPRPVGGPAPGSARSTPPRRWRSRSSTAA